MLVLLVIAVLVLIGFLVWALRDVLAYSLELLAYALRALCLGVVQVAVGAINAMDELLDGSVGDEPLLRGLAVAGFGFVLGLIILFLTSLARGTHWVFTILIGTTGVGLCLGLIADPERDWRIGPPPSYGNHDGNAGTPLNL